MKITKARNMKTKMKILTKIQNTQIASVFDILQFEEKFNLNLPYDYKWFLLTQNPLQVVESSNIGIADIHCFYPMVADIMANLHNGYDSLVHYFASSYLPFAYDAGGWQFVICIEQGDNYGKVYFCRMDEEPDKALTFLANNFEEFINKLEENHS